MDQSGEIDPTHNARCTKAGKLQGSCQTFNDSVNVCWMFTECSLSLECETLDMGERQCTSKEVLCGTEKKNEIKLLHNLTVPPSEVRLRLEKGGKAGIMCWWLI